MIQNENYSIINQFKEIDNDAKTLCSPLYLVYLGETQHTRVR